MGRVRYLLLVAALLGVMGSAWAQNLLQNPGFESERAWNEFWVLSTTDPSSVTAVGSENTTDVHGGLRSAQLSNTEGNKWTYFYSDVVNAPISLIANERYVVRGWMKSLEEGKQLTLSLVWNNSREQAIIYDGNPSPASNPDWLMVEDTIKVSGNFSDAYLSIGFRAGKIGNLAAGILLLDDFSVERLISIETDVLAFSVEEQTGPAVIDNSLHTITLEVPYSTDVSALVPTIELSPGAISLPGSGVELDFTTPRVYQVTAEDGISTQDWTVYIERSPPSSETDILAFTVEEQTGPSTIDNVYHTIILEIAYGVDRTSIIPNIEVSPGATIFPGSGVAVDFSAPATFTVTAEDGLTSQDYIVVIMSAPLSNKTDIRSFSVAEELEPATIDGLFHTVTLVLPSWVDLSSLSPEIGVSVGASINPGSGIPQDFSAPLVYAVTAEDGVNVQDWTVQVEIRLNDQTDIESFTLNEQVGNTEIDKIWHTVSLQVPYGTDVTALLPDIGLSRGASILPGAGVPGDFSGPLSYTVIAEDGITRQDWTVNVQVQLNDQAEIEYFSIVDEISQASISPLTNEVILAVPFETDVSALVPTIEVSPGAEVFPGSGVVRDFSSPLTYTVTAEDKTTKEEWTVTVVVLPSDQTSILSFSVAEQVSPAFIDHQMNTVSLEVPFGTDVTRLVPAIEVSEGATIAPGSGVAADFTDPLTYTVTALDGVSSREWRVSVKIQPNNQAEILSFSLPEEVSGATIDPQGYTVSLEVPFGTDVTKLVPAIEVSMGASIDPGSGIASDFSMPVLYTVTAMDGVTSREWRVSVKILPNNQAEILSFSIAEEKAPAIIDPFLNQVSLEVGSDTDLGAMIPDIEVSTGASSDPGSGVATDFTHPVEYRVTAEDGVSVRSWTVIVNRDEAVNVSDSEASNGVKIYPNPAREYLHIDLTERGVISLFDMTGRVVRQVWDATESNRIQVGDLERGSYLIQVQSAGSNQVYRVLLN